MKNLKKIGLIVFAGVIVIIFGILSLRLLTPEDDWICQNNQWVKHGHPKSEMPTKPCK